MVSNSQTAQNNIGDLQTWHRRLGHLNIQSILKLSKNNVVNGFTLSDSHNNLEYETCLATKATRSPFPKNAANRAKRPGELIHSDIWGPVSIPSVQGNRYFASFIDDYSRYTTVYLLKNKSDYYHFFLQYCNMVRNKFNRDITIIHSDNGGEYRSNKIKDYCIQYGIQQRFTVPNNPEMNGIAERMNRTLIEMVRAMLKDSGLEKHFWGEALNYATYVRNHCLTSALKHIVPIEAWDSLKPSISHLQIFGSTVYAQLSNPKRSKLDDKATKCIFLGFEPNTQGYRLLLSGTTRIAVSRDVTFTHETTPIVKSNTLTSNSILSGTLDEYEEHEEQEESEPLVLPVETNDTNTVPNEEIQQNDSNGNTSTTSYYSVIYN